ncbi:MAG: hypothetical protein ABI767_00610 [Rhodanobacter sp.]
MPMHRIVFAIALATLTSGCASQPPQSQVARRPSTSFRLVNASFDSIVTLQIAPAGSNAFRTIDLGWPLQGGLTATSFRVPAGECLRDLRITFRDGDVTQLSPIDMCRSNGVRIGAR